MTVIERRGAWWVDGGSYRKGMAGTLGQDVDAQSDTLGWALRSLKYELDFNGFRGAMVLDTAVLGDAYDRQVRLFQASRGLAVDGAAGPRTLAALLEKRCAAAEATNGLPVGSSYRIVGHESGFDLAAIGSADYLDRGPTQKHLYSGGSVNLGQAIRPALAIPRLASQLAFVAAAFDPDTAVASWNVGEGAAEWWFEHGKPETGGPSWWSDGDLSARIVGYLAAVSAVRVPYA